MKNIVFIDFGKAFDSIWHEGQFLKHLIHQISGPFYNIKDMYQKVTVSVKSSSGNRSIILPVQRGVNQGDVLSPYFFKFLSTTSSHWFIKILLAIGNIRHASIKHSLLPSCK